MISPVWPPEVSTAMGTDFYAQVGVHFRSASFSCSVLNTCTGTLLDALGPGAWLASFSQSSVVTVLHFALVESLSR